MKKVVAIILSTVLPILTFATTMNLSDAINKGVVKMEGICSGRKVYRQSHKTYHYKQQR